MTVGENIRFLRKEKGITQRELAEKCECATGTIQQYELGKRQPRLEQLKRIAKILGVYVGELLADNFEEYKEQLINDFSDMVINASKNATITTRTLYGDPEKSDRLNEYFEMLNDEGQDKAVEQVELLTKIPEYQKEPSEE